MKRHITYFWILSICTLTTKLSAANQLPLAGQSTSWYAPVLARLQSYASESANWKLPWASPLTHTSSSSTFWDRVTSLPSVASIVGIMATLGTGAYLYKYGWFSRNRAPINTSWQEEPFYPITKRQRVSHLDAKENIQKMGLENVIPDIFEKESSFTIFDKAKKVTIRSNSLQISQKLPEQMGYENSTMHLTIPLASRTNTYGQVNVAQNVQDYWKYRVYRTSLQQEHQNKPYFIPLHTIHPLALVAAIGTGIYSKKSVTGTALHGNDTFTINDVDVEIFNDTMEKSIYHRTGQLKVSVTAPEQPGLKPTVTDLQLIVP